jgi:hypothetical protein
MGQSNSMPGYPCRPSLRTQSRSSRLNRSASSLETLLKGITMDLNARTSTLPWTSVCKGQPGGDDSVDCPNCEPTSLGLVVAEGNHCDGSAVSCREKADPARSPIQPTSLRSKFTAACDRLESALVDLLSLQQRLSRKKRLTVSPTEGNSCEYSTTPSPPEEAELEMPSLSSLGLGKLLGSSTSFPLVVGNVLEEPHFTAGSSDLGNIMSELQHRPLDSDDKVLSKAPRGPKIFLRAQATTNGPPPTAPTEPAAMRRRTVLQQQQSQPEGFQTPPSRQISGSWTQSKSWQSEAARLKAEFDKMTLSLQRIGANESPFVPKSPAAYATFKLQSLQRVIDKMKSKKKNSDIPTAAEEEENTGPVLMGGKKFADNLSPVFAVRTCFNDAYTRYPTRHADEVVEWPSLNELKGEGSQRAKQNFGRYLPLPKLNRIDPRYMNEGPVSLFNPDGTIKHDKKAAVDETYDWAPSSYLMEAYCIPAEEVHLDELPEVTAGFIEKLLTKEP